MPYMSGSVHTSPPPTLLHEDFLRPTLVFGQSLRLQRAGPWLAVVCGAANFLWKSTSLKCFSSSLNLKYFKIYYINMSVLMVLEGVLIKTKKDDI